MDANAAIEITWLTAPALSATVDVLAITTFGDLTKDAVFKSLDQALGGWLSDVAKSESFEGKTGQSIGFYTQGKIPAKRVLKFRVAKACKDAVLSKK